MCKFTKPVIPADATADERRSLMFDAMYNADLSEEVEKKNGLSYVSWSQAWKVFKQFYPSATYKIHTSPATGLPYFVDPLMGIMVHTEITADGLTYENWLPIMDYQNRSQMAGEAYTLQIYDKFKKQYVEKRVEKAYVFDANASVQRSLCKCMAMHGLALRLYSGLEFNDEHPDNSQQNNTAPVSQPTRQQYNRPAQPQPQQASADPHAALKAQINATTDVSALVSLYLDNTQVIEGNPELKAILTNRKKALQTI